MLQHQRVDLRVGLFLFRDGVSESQFQECLEVEFTAFKRVRAFFFTPSSVLPRTIVLPLSCSVPCVIPFLRMLTYSSCIPGLRRSRGRVQSGDHIHRCPEAPQHALLSSGQRQVAQWKRSTRYVSSPAPELHLSFIVCYWKHQRAQNRVCEVIVLTGFRMLLHLYSC
jgi:hypothetical protein